MCWTKFEVKIPSLHSRPSISPVKVSYDGFLLKLEQPEENRQSIFVDVCPTHQMPLTMMGWAHQSFNKHGLMESWVRILVWDVRAKLCIVCSEGKNEQQALTESPSLTFEGGLSFWTNVHKLFVSLSPPPGFFSEFQIGQKFCFKTRNVFSLWQPWVSLSSH